MTALPPDPEATPSDQPPAIDPDEHRRLALENTLLRAGVDLDSEQGKLVAQAWENRTPELEAIKAQWELVKPAPPAPEPTEAPRLEGEEAQAEERRSLAASTVVEPNPTDVDPRDQAITAGLGALMPARGAAGTRDDAMATGVHVLLEAAANGDNRVLAVDHGETGF